MTPDNKTVIVTYRNHRGETAQRLIRPHTLRFGRSEWHPEPQWLLECFDHGKNDFRTYAMREVQSNWEPITDAALAALPPRVPDAPGD